MKLGAFLFVLILVSAVDANKVKRLLRRHVVLAGTELCTPTNGELAFVEYRHVRRLCLYKKSKCN